MAGRITEEGTALSVPEGVFYNPEMELCRSMFSLAVGAIGSKLSVLDAMCASGVRGIRYRKENRNVRRLLLSDLSSRAAACAKRNAAANRVRCRCVRSDANRMLRSGSAGFDFVELDPFGSPSPFLHDALGHFADSDGGWLSVTATDMAVLCGAHHAACLKNYGAAPLDNEFCHENAVRILAGKAILEAAPFNLSARPVFSLSHRHYVKVMFELAAGAEAAVASVKSLGFVSWCPGCCHREAARLPRRSACPHCGHVLEHAGPLFLGKLWKAELLEGMQELGAQRKYRQGKEIGKILSTMAAESRIDAYGYYDLHVLAKKLKARIKSIDEALEALRAGGFAASRTHFCPTAVRTDALHGKVLEALRT